MSQNWRFSPCNEALVQACIEHAASQEDSNNKFLMLREINDNQDSMNRNPTVDLTSPETVSYSTVITTHSPSDAVKDHSQMEQLIELLESEPATHFEEFVTEIVKNPSFSLQLAQNLSSSSIEKICKHVFTQKCLDTSFFVSFYKDFFPAYLKRQYSWFSLDLIIKASSAHPEQFVYLLNELLHDIDIQTKILQDYVQALNEAKKKEFMKMIMEIGFTNEPFQRHLFSVYTAYKDCDLDEDLQSFLLGNLLKISNDCASDKHYGRFLLEFIRKENTPGHETEYLDVLGKLVDIHRSPFKRVCESLLSQINNRLENQNVERNYAQWNIPRPDD